MNRPRSVLLAASGLRHPHHHDVQQPTAVLSALFLLEARAFPSLSTLPAAAVAAGMAQAASSSTPASLPPHPPIQQKLRLVEQALAAVSGAIITSIITTPLDVTKVRMQNPASMVVDCEHPACAGTSSSSMMIRVARHEGVSSLWSGLQPALLMSVPGTVIYFSLYEVVRDAIAKRCPERAKDSAPLLAGGGSRLLTATIVSPVELMRTRMQAEQALLKEGMVGGAAALVRREGYGALWKGLSATLWRDVPFSCLYWYGYEALKRRAHQAGFGGDSGSGSGGGGGGGGGSGSAQELDPGVSFLCGATSGAFAAFCTTPFDVLKTRRQVARMATESGRGASASATPSLSTPRLVLHVARQEGVGALFAGWVPRLVKVAPSCAVMIASYELGKAFFRRRRAAVSLS